MSGQYHEQQDLGVLMEMGKIAPQEFHAWLGLDQIVAHEDGLVPRKYRELIAVAVALTTQCPYCIDVHVKAAKSAGAEAQELAETIFIAAALRAGAAASHGGYAMKIYESER